MKNYYNNAFLGSGLVIFIIVIGFLINPFISQYFSGANENFLGVQKTYRDDLYIRFSTWDLSKNDIEKIFIIDVNEDGIVLDYHTLELSTNNNNGLKNYFVGTSDYSELQSADFILVYTANTDGDSFDEWQLRISVYDNERLYESPSTNFFGGKKDESTLHQYLLQNIIGDPRETYRIGGRQHNGVLLANKTWSDLWNWLENQDDPKITEFTFPLNRTY